MCNRLNIYLYSVLLIFSFSCDDSPTSTNTNSAPVASFSIVPQNGTLDTTFQFDASNSTDKEDPTSDLRIRWDWENDGVWDTGSSTNKMASHKYSTPGTKSIKLEVMDSKGLTSDTTKNLHVSIINNSAPVASFMVSPQSGTVDTIFYFDASNSYDSEDSTSNLEIRWDWENDGTWDTEYSIAKKTEHQYNSPGTKTIKLEVIDSNGLSSDTTKSVFVSLNQITISGNILDIETYSPIPSVRIDAISGLDTLVNYANSNGEFNFNINKNSIYEIHCFSLKYADTSFSYISDINATIDIKLCPIDYYPTKIGSYWKYITEYSDRWLTKKHIIIERQITENSGNIIKSNIHISGYIKKWEQDTVYVNEVIYESEQIDENGSMFSFLHSIPAEYYSTNYDAISKYLHVGMYSTINNPSEIIPCEYWNYNLFPNTRSIKSENSYNNLNASHTEYIIIANQIGIVEIFYHHQDSHHNNTNTSLKLVETNLPFE